MAETAHVVRNLWERLCVFGLPGVLHSFHLLVDLVPSRPDLQKEEDKEGHFRFQETPILLLISPPCHSGNRRMSRYFTEAVMADSDEVPLGSNHPTLGPFVRYGWGGPEITHIALMWVVY